MEDNVVFRRINGRVIPIRTSDKSNNAITKRPRKPRRPKTVETEVKLERSLVAGGATGGAVFGQGKLAITALSNRIGDINASIKSRSVPRPKSPGPKPSFHAKFGRDTSPMGKLLEKQYKSDSKKWNRASKSFVKDSINYKISRHVIKPLRFQRMQASHFRSVLNRRLLPVAIGVGAVAGGLELINQVRK